MHVTPTTALHPVLWKRQGSHGKTLCGCNLMLYRNGVQNESESPNLFFFNFLAFECCSVQP